MNYIKVKTSFGVLTIYPHNVELQKYRLSCFKSDKLLTKPRLLDEINGGLEGIVYKVDENNAIKIYKQFPEKPVIKKRMIEKLSQIPTKRIIMPKEPIIGEDNKILGHTMRYVYNTLVEEGYYEEILGSLLRLPKSKLIEYLDDIKEDLILLGNNNIEVNDINEGSCIINKDGIYLVDCGDYTEKQHNMANDNIRMFNAFIRERILQDQGCYNQKDEEDVVSYLNKLQKMYSNIDIEDNPVFIGDYLKEHMEDDEDLLDVVYKQKIKSKNNELKENNQHNV